jgi:tRNA G18 (ribose-2'-O)-methylase SpoU
MVAKRGSRNVFLILDNVRSTYNVGAIFRTADAAGVSGVYLCGYTPAPLDRFGRPVSAIAKTALGAETHLPWESHKDPDKLRTLLWKQGVSTVVLEQTVNAQDIYTFSTPETDTAYVVGNEVAGVTSQWLGFGVSEVYIPMRGKKESLNVAVATGIMLYVAESASIQ